MFEVLKGVVLKEKWGRFCSEGCSLPELEYEVSDKHGNYTCVIPTSYKQIEKEFKNTNIIEDGVYTIEIVGEKERVVIITVYAE